MILQTASPTAQFEPGAGASAARAGVSYDPEKHLPQLLEQYKTFVEMADRLSARRMLANNSFITMLGAGALAYSAAPTYFKGGFEAILQLGVAVGCILLALMWRATLKYFRDLSTAKFRVIHDLEMQLPSQPFADEWKYLSASKSAHNSSFMTLTSIEMLVPVIAAGISLCGFAYALWLQLPGAWTHSAH
jgi:hypothetical protein